jgi:hypothetical protein
MRDSTSRLYGCPNHREVGWKYGAYCSHPEGSRAVQQASHKHCTITAEFGTFTSFVLCCSVTRSTVPGRAPRFHPYPTFDSEWTLYHRVLYSRVVTRAHQCAHPSRTGRTAAVPAVTHADGLQWCRGSCHDQSVRRSSSYRLGQLGQRHRRAGRQPSTVTALGRAVAGPPGPAGPRPTAGNGPPGRRPGLSARPGSRFESPAGHRKWARCRRAAQTRAHGRGSDPTFKFDRDRGSVANPSNRTRSLRLTDILRMKMILSS